MSAQLTKDDLRGFLLPYKLTKSNIWTAESSYTQDEFFSSTPSPAAATKQTLTATGNPTSTTNLQVITRDAGVNRSGGFVLRNNTDSPTIEYGWDSVSSISHFEVLAYQQTAILGDKGLYPDAVSFDDGTILTACQYNQIGITLREVRVFKRDKTGAITSQVIFSWDSLTGITQNVYPALCILDDGSVLCVFQVEEDSKITFFSYRSTDRGSSWEKASQNCVDYYITVGAAGSTYQIKRVKLASCFGQILMLVETFFNTATNAQNRLFQFVSVDGGASFTMITDEAKLDDHSFASINLFVRNNEFCLSYIGTREQAHFMRIPHAFYSVQDLRTAAKYIIAVDLLGASLADGTDLGMTNANLASWISDDGDIWFVYHYLLGDRIQLAYSRDGWTFQTQLNSLTGNNPILFYCDTQVANLAHLYLRNMVGVSYRGGSALVFNWDNNTAATGDSLGLLHLGSYTTTPNLNELNKMDLKNSLNRKGWRVTYLPLDTPQVLSQFTVSGTGIENLSTSAALQVMVTSAQTDRLYEYVNGDATNGVYIKTIVYEVATGAGASAWGYILVQHENIGKLKSGIEIKCTASNFIIYDLVAGIAKATISFDCNAGVEFFVALDSPNVTVWYKSKDTNNMRKYLVAYNGSLATVATATSNLATIKFGVLGSPTGGTCSTKWNMLLIGDEDYIGTNIVSQADTDLAIRDYPSVSKEVYLDDSVNIQVINGPTYYNDSWEILPESYFPIDNIFHTVSPTPRKYWKSTTVVSGAVSSQNIAFQLDPNSVSNSTNLGNDLMGLYMGNINFRRFYLQYWNGASWTTYPLLGIDTSEGMYHGFIKTGLSISQDPATLHNQSYYFHNELVDYYAEITVGISITYHKIVSNTEGVFGNSNGKKAVILLDTEPSGNGTVRIIPNNISLILSLNGIQSAAWRIQILTQQTYERNFRIGHLSLGAVAITGTQYSKGRKIIIESGSITTEQPNRTEYSKVVAPIRRTVQISWSDGIDLSKFYDTNPDPDYYKSSSSVGAEAVSNYQDAPYMLEGMLHYLDGNRLPLVYLPAISTSDDSRIYNRKAQHLLGTIDGDISLESVTGDELRGDGVGEIMRIASINLKEIV